MRRLQWLWAIIVVLLPVGGAQAQDNSLSFNTIDRPPFSFEADGAATGFSIELMQMVAESLGREVSFTFVDTFPDMLGAVEAGTVDGAIANISITSERERAMDFSQPIFESGLQIMASGSAGESSIWNAIFSVDLFIAILAAFAILFVLGLLMWVFERRRQAYFDRPARQAMFPAFWWALNLVVNGGFEERAPQSAMGRVLGVIMVVSSLFIVSIFVANITASLTVDAITGTIDDLNDLDGRKVATTTGSTASAFLQSRGIAHQTFDSFNALTDAFEAQGLDAVVFDGPLLAYFLTTTPGLEANLIERVFRPEDYGIALPQGSGLREEINRALLELNESGTYQELRLKWFGSR